MAFRLFTLRKPRGGARIFAVHGMSGALWMLSAILAAGLLGSCGDDKEEQKDDPKPEATPTPEPAVETTEDPSPQATPAPSNAPAGFWAASDSQRVVSSFDANGASTAVIDFQAYLPVGGITALSFLPDSVGGGLVALMDRQTESAGEYLSLIDPQSAKIQAPYWYLDNVNLTDLETYSIISDALPNSLLIPRSNGIERLLLGQGVPPNRISGVGGSGPWLSGFGTTGPSCRTDTIVSAATVAHASAKFLMVNSIGEGATYLNLIRSLDSAPACLSAYDYGAADLPTAAADTPVNAMQMPDGKIYVLYAHSTASKIVSYDFDGTSLSNPSVLFADAAVLGVAPRGLAARTHSTLLFGNSTNGTVYEVSTSGELTGFFVQSSFLVGVSSLVSKL
jgi:hypothetical protein